MEAIKKIASAYESDTLVASNIETDPIMVKARWAMRIKGNYAYLIKNLAQKFINKEFRDQTNEGLMKINIWIQSNKFLTKIGETQDGKIKIAARKDKKKGKGKGKGNGKGRKQQRKPRNFKGKKNFNKKRR